MFYLSSKIRKNKIHLKNKIASNQKLKYFVKCWIPYNYRHLKKHIQMNRLPE